MVLSDVILSDVITNFKFQGEFVAAREFEFGHINDTYILYFNGNGNIQDKDEFRYILQRINQNVFKDPPQLMENIVKVVQHLRRKIAARGGDPRRETLNIVPSIEGANYFRCSQGGYWRAYEYIEGTQSYQVVENAAQFYGAGRVVGKFQHMLSDFPADELHETIPDFHNTSKRYEALMNAVERDPLHRASNALPEIDMVRARAGELSRLIDMQHRGSLPVRVIHNDTKFNNVLIDDKTGEGVCLVDLDTVMPGLALYDFGDAIRYGTNRAGEDQKDLSRVQMEMELFEEFCRGYFEEAGEFLTAEEVQCLAFSAWLITMEVGIRFLTDYLEGDIYFKTQREGQNLNRARTQFKLVEDMEAKYEQMEAVVRKYGNIIIK